MVDVDSMTTDELAQLEAKIKLAKKFRSKTESESVDVSDSGKSGDEPAQRVFEVGTRRGLDYQSAKRDARRKIAMIREGVKE